MKKQFLIVAVIIASSITIRAQSKFNIGAGYFGENISSPGIVLEFEYEKYYTEDVSLPLRVDIIFFSAPEYNSLVVDIHKGFRKYFKSGLFIEQSVGIGLISTFYTLESIWYLDKYRNVVLYSEGANLGIMPSITAGIGYNFSPNKEKANTIWVRPKVYWNLAVRNFNMPYGAIQIGYTYNFK